MGCCGRSAGEFGNIRKMWYGMELSAENKLQFYVPRGFAHGFVVLSEAAVFPINVIIFITKESEGSVKFNDSDLNIDWKIGEADMILSEKRSECSVF